MSRDPQTGLTKNQTLVYGALSEAGGPLSAYTILDKLRDDGFRAPLQVYRALDKLVASGVVHRLETLNAFVACQHPACETHESVVFAICETCSKVSEIADAGLSQRLAELADDQGFELQRSAVELRGCCATCFAQESDKQASTS